MNSHGVAMVTPVRIPADVEREDRVLANLTARQLALLSVVAVLLYGAYGATRRLVPPVVFAIVAVPVAVVAIVVVLGSRDGLSVDRLLVAAVRQRRAPRVQVAAAGEIPEAPEWITTHATSEGGRSRRDTVSPGALRLPAEGVSDSTAGSGIGVVDLGVDGVAVVCVCSTVNFALRTPEEQEALVATFGRYLHSLTTPVQFLIRAQRLDLTSQVVELHERAAALPHPALEHAALEHADYLAHLAHQSTLLRRQVLLVLREPLRPPGTVLTRLSLSGPVSLFSRRARRAEGRASDGARHAAEGRLARRVGEAIGLLSAAGVVLTPLDAAQADAVLAGACNPDRLVPPTAPLAAYDDIITTATAQGTESQGWSGWSTTCPTRSDSADEWNGVDGNELLPPASATSTGGSWWDR